VKRLTPAQFVTTLSVLLLAVAAIGVLAMTSGSSDIGAAEVLAALSGRDVSPAARDIIIEVRLPRLILALIVGASLATAGVIFQALLRNPLADPFILGVSGGAALGGIAMLVLGGAIGLGYEAVPPAAFLGCLATTAILYFAAGGGGRYSGTSLLLMGVVFNSFASAAIVFLASIAGFESGSKIFFWLIGSLAAVRIDVVGPVSLLLAAGLGVSLWRARGLNLLALGDETAAQLGMAVGRDRGLLLVATSLMVGAAVSISGLIGFVGLIVPHALRLVIGPDHRLLIPAAAITGGGFLALCDTVARTALAGRELPVGAITALVGGPLFLLLLRRQQQRMFLG